jgi:hypothetical protein
MFCDQSRVVVLDCPVQETLRRSASAHVLDKTPRCTVVIAIGETELEQVVRPEVFYHHRVDFNSKMGISEHFAARLAFGILVNTCVGIDVMKDGVVN